MNIAGVEIDLVQVVTAVGVLWTTFTTLRTRSAQKVKANQVAAIEHEVKPNGGASLRDAVDRIERKVDAMAATVDANTARIVVLERTAPEAT